MRSLGLLLFGLCVVMTAIGSPVTVVEIANFYCPHCYAVNRCLPAIEKRIQAQQGAFDFVPVFFNAVTSSAARAYLGLQGKALSEARDALFSAIQAEGLNLDSMTSACDVIHRNTTISFQRCMDGAKSKRPGLRFMHLQQLVQKAKLDQGNHALPIFIIEVDQKIKTLLSFDQTQDATALCEALNHAI